MLEIQCSIHLIHHSFSLQSCTKYGLDILIAASAERKKNKTLLPTFMSYLGHMHVRKQISCRVIAIEIEAYVRHLWQEWPIPMGREVGGGNRTCDSGFEG